MLATLVALSKLNGIPSRRYIDPGIDAAVELMDMEQITSPQASGILTRIALDEETPISWLPKEKSRTVARFLSDRISGLVGEDRKRAIDMICQHGSETDQQASLMKNHLDQRERERINVSISFSRKYTNPDTPAQTGSGEKMEKREPGFLENARDSLSSFYRAIERSIRSGLRLGIESFVVLPAAILSLAFNAIEDIAGRMQDRMVRDSKKTATSPKKRIAIAKKNEERYGDVHANDAKPAMIAAESDQARESEAADQATDEDGIAGSRRIPGIRP
jgi:hypothetical protein